MSEQSQCSKAGILCCLVRNCDQKNIRNEKRLFIHVLTQHPSEYLRIKRRGWRQMIFDLPGCADSITLQKMRQNELLAPSVQEIQESPSFSPASSKEFQIRDEMFEPLITHVNIDRESTGQVSPPSTPLCDEIPYSNNVDTIVRSKRQEKVGDISIDLVQNSSKRKLDPLTSLSNRNRQETTTSSTRRVESTSTDNSTRMAIYNSPTRPTVTHCEPNLTEAKNSSVRNRLGKRMTRNPAVDLRTSRLGGLKALMESPVKRNRQSTSKSKSPVVAPTSPITVANNRNRVRQAVANNRNMSARAAANNRNIGARAAANNRNMGARAAANNRDIGARAAANNRNMGALNLRHKCLLCPSTFYSLEDVLTHDLYSHEDHRRFPCPLCFRFVAKSIVSLREHLSMEHNHWQNWQTVPCSFCKVVFPLPSFENHLKTEYEKLRRQLYEELEHYSLVACFHCNLFFSNATLFRSHLCRKSNELTGKLLGRFGQRFECKHAHVVCNKFPTCYSEMCEFAHPSCNYGSNCKDENCRLFHTVSVRANCRSCSKYRNQKN